MYELFHHETTKQSPHDLAEQYMAGDGIGDAYDRMYHRLAAPYNMTGSREELTNGLKAIITEQQAEIWLHFPQFSYFGTGMSLDEAYRTIPKDFNSNLRRDCEHMEAYQLLVSIIRDDGTKAYMRNYFMSLVAGYLNDKDAPGQAPKFYQALLDWWLELVDEGGTSKLQPKIPDFRVLAHQGTLTGTTTSGKIPMNLEIPDQRCILEMDKAESILRNSEKIAVQKCACRMVKDAVNIRECNSPLEVCLTFDYAAECDVEAGIAHYITVDEAIAMIAKCHDLGMMQVVSNYEQPLAMCNCCSCCCINVRSMQRYYQGLCLPSRYLANISRKDDCIGCGLCAKLCPMDAIQIIDKKSTITEQRCFGCGVCVSHCPKGALRLIPRPGAEDERGTWKMDSIYI